jgi:hypothetical protein
MSRELGGKTGIKWPVYKRLRRRGIEYYPVRDHPETDEARRVLEQAGRRLDGCQDCASMSSSLAVHHIDGNPYNNAVENLAVLCPQCHLSRHGPAEEEGVVSWYEGAIRDRQSIHEESEIEEEKRKSRSVKIVLKVAVFRCRECGGLTRVEMAGSVMRGPDGCAHCKNKRGFDFVERLSTFASPEE